MVLSSFECVCACVRASMVIRCLFSFPCMLRARVCERSWHALTGCDNTTSPKGGRTRVPKIFHEDVAKELNARVEDLQFQFPVTAALQQINVNAENFNEAFGWFKVLESISDEDKVRIFANVVVPKQKTKKRHKPSRETFLKRIKFVQAVMVRRMHVNCAWLRCTRMCAQAQHNGDLTATSNDSDPSNSMGLEASVAPQRNVRQPGFAILDQAKCLERLIQTVLDNGWDQS